MYSKGMCYEALKGSKCFFLIADNSLSMRVASSFQYETAKTLRTKHTAQQGKLPLTKQPPGIDIKQKANILLKTSVPAHPTPVHKSTEIHQTDLTDR